MESSVNRQARGDDGLFCKYAVFIIKVLFSVFSFFGKFICNSVQFPILWSFF